ncbi:uncharacterized protein MKZ38_010196 [Zalerion maritima]|uniref:Uncharacterized protein n=1 Tax=Zalerion maritima TaxID=339359 RepID=A0AAD5RUE9_9PEZI|nr:uncharacterized protein MKZ38_010196 [Zalerion maritima]
METPSIPLPTDAREQQVLDKLVIIRDHLLLLKQDRRNYIRTQDIIPLYDQVIEQVRALNEQRQNQDPRDENRGKHITSFDRVLESCFQLLSLFFMTVGRNNEAPAAYALTSTIRRLLDHLTEGDVYSAKDLDSISDEVEKLVDVVTSSAPHSSPYLMTLLSKRLEKCSSMLKILQSKLDRLAEPLMATHEKSISIFRSISLFNTRTRFSTSEVKKLQDKIKEVDATRVDGKFVNEAGEVLDGSDVVCEVLERCLRWSDIVLERKGVIPENFKPIYDTLVGVRNELEKVTLTKAWSLRETDLYDYQRKLDRVDESRVNGNWLDEYGRPAELYVQRTFLYLLRRSYGYLYSLMLSSEPVSEALLPTYNQLQTLKRCLVEVKASGGVSSERDLYPYSMKLHSIESMKTDGKFMVGDDIPEGQASVTGLLAECFELNYELRVDALDQTKAENQKEKEEAEPKEPPKGNGDEQAVAAT